MNTSHQKKILIVDDDKSIHRLLNFTLKHLGHITCVDSGNKAIQTLKEQAFDLILADYEMPEGNGMDVLDYLTETKNSTLTIMITAFGTKDLVVKSMEHHVFAFIEKPFTHDAVVNTVKDALARRDKQVAAENLARLGTAVGEVVHEISNPLTVLDLNIRQLNEDPAGSDVTSMLRSVEKIRDIIVATKDTMRGNVKVEREGVSIAECIQESSAEYGIRAANQGVPVSVEGDLEYFCLGQKLKLSQIIVNLVNNAIDAAAEQHSLGTKEKWVKISGKKEDQHLFISVTDSGHGIPKDLHEKIFDNLYTTKGKNGSGLGLGIVRKLTQELHGQVSVNPNSKNTQFVLKLPLYFK